MPTYGKNSETNNGALTPEISVTSCKNCAYLNKRTEELEHSFSTLCDTQEMEKYLDSVNTDPSHTSVTQTLLGDDNTSWPLCGAGDPATAAVSDRRAAAPLLSSGTMDS